LVTAKPKAVFKSGSLKGEPEKIILFLGGAIEGMPKLGK
jgi:hypothetical protein